MLGTALWAPPGGGASDVKLMPPVGGVNAEFWNVEGMGTQREIVVPEVMRMNFSCLFLSRIRYYSVLWMLGWHQMRQLLLATKSVKTREAGKEHYLERGLPKKGTDT